MKYSMNKKTFHQELYSSNAEVHFSLVNLSGISLSDQLRMQLEVFISEDELFDALMTLKTGKVCGVDGLTLEFYRTFWRKLVCPLHAMLSHAIEQGRLSTFAHCRIINLIPKKGKDDKLVHNWQPITLLNYDYKLYAKALANRLDVVIPDLVGKQQTGFIKGRTIHSNLSKTREVIAYLNKTGTPGVIAMVDFEKCFDCIEYNSIVGALKYFNYGPKFMDMIMLLFADFYISTQNNRYQSDLFWKKRGVNQGCPTSPAIFTQTCAIMEHLIKQNSNIKGINIKGLEFLLSQFTNDTGAFLTFDPICINEFCNVLATVERQVSLKVSYEKMSLY